MPRKSKPLETPAGLRRRAERHAGNPDATAAVAHAETDARRLLHELEVHQIELEMQNAELQIARDEAEALLEKYTDLYDFAPVGYFTLATDGAIRLVNLTGSVLVGVERSKLVGRAFGMLVAPEHRAAFKAFLYQVFAGADRQSADFELVGPELVCRVVNIEAQRAPNGAECSALMVDITARKRAEDAVRISEIRYRRLFEAAHDGILLLDPGTCKITDANPFMTRLLGYPRDQLIGKELFEIGLLKDEAASREMFRNLQRNHEVRYEDLPLESQDGRHQEVEVVANLYQEGGHAVIQCHFRDITERVRAETTQRRLDVLTVTNLKLKQEIVRRQAVEEELRATRKRQSQVLKQSRLLQEQLRKLTHGILHAQEEERKRISRELHDVIAQTLVGINVHLAALTQSAAAAPGNLRQQIALTHLLVEKAVDTVHDFTRELRPTMLDDLGLIPTLQSYMRGFMTDTGIRVSLKAFARIEQAPGVVRTVLYRITQEALTNVARHAKASRVAVCIEAEGGIIRLEITDNGQGFDTGDQARAKKTKRLGLIGMRERVEMIGGSFQVESASGGPTTVRVEIPAGKAGPKE